MIITPKNGEGKTKCTPGVPESVIGADYRLTPSAVEVYRVMAEFAASTGRCFAAVATIAQRAGKSTSTAKRSIRDLAHFGYLKEYADPTKKTLRGYLFPSRPLTECAGFPSPGDRRRARDAAAQSERRSLRGQTNFCLTPEELPLIVVQEENTESLPSRAGAHAHAREGFPGGAGCTNSLGDPGQLKPEIAPRRLDQAEVSVLDAALRERAAGASLAWGTTDQAVCSAAMNARFGPTDRNDSGKSYDLACSMVAGGEASDDDFREAIELALKPGAVRPGAVFVSKFRLGKRWMRSAVEPESEVQRLA